MLAANWAQRLLAHPRPFFIAVLATVVPTVTYQEYKAQKHDFSIAPVGQAPLLYDSNA